MNLLTTKQASAHLNVPKKTLEQWRCSGIGPPFLRFNARCIRYRVAQLEAWMESKALTSTSAAPAAA